MPNFIKFNMLMKNLIRKYFNNIGITNKIDEQTKMLEHEQAMHLKDRYAQYSYKIPPSTNTFGGNYTFAGTSTQFNAVSEGSFENEPTMIRQQEAQATTSETLTYRNNIYEYEKTPSPTKMGLIFGILLLLSLILIIWGLSRFVG